MTTIVKQKKKPSQTKQKTNWNQLNQIKENKN